MPRKKKQSSEAAVRDIRRKTCRRFSAEAIPKLPCTYSRGLMPGRSRTRNKHFSSSSHSAKANIPC
jgi:hypothetical protein